MDGSEKSKDRQVDVDERIREIKAHMPATYASIQAKAAEIGRGAFGLVRRGIAGQANAFYAIEHGRVVGTPFAEGNISAEVAKVMVQFSCRSVVMWSTSTMLKQEAVDAAQ